MLTYLDIFFQNGFRFFIIFFVVSFIVTILLSKYSIYILNKRSYKNTNLITKIIRIAFYSVWIYLLMLQFNPLRNFTLSLLASGGVVALVIGFASQDSISNLISGLFIILFKPFVIGDTIKVENGLISGVVEDITLRHTIIRSFENTKQVISNTRLNSFIVENISDFKSSKGLPLVFMLEFDTDHSTALSIIEHTLDTHPRILRYTDVLATNTTLHGVEVKSMVFCENAATSNTTLSELRIEILKSFKENGIELAKTIAKIKEA